MRKHMHVMELSVLHLMFLLQPVMLVSALSATSAFQKQLHVASPLRTCEGLDCVVQYVQTPDPAYSWYDTKVRLHGRDESSGVSWTGHVLNMTSQKWDTPAGAKFPSWWHTLIVVIPDNREVFDWSTVLLDFGIHDADGNLTRIDNRPSTAPQDEQDSIYIDKDNLESHVDDLHKVAWKAAFLAARTRAITTVVLNLPNEYVEFENDPSEFPRVADYLKSYSYLDFIREPDEPERISELPTAKAVVRALDTATAFTANLPGGHGPVKRFGITAYSKLATPTWMLGALDERVKIIVPMAINIDTDHFRTATQLHSLPNIKMAKTPKASKRPPEGDADNYVPLVMSNGLPGYDKLKAIIDPVSWMDKLTVPKLYIMAANDHTLPYLGRVVEPFLPGMPAYTGVQMVPNCEHDAVLVKSLNSSAAFFRGFLLGKPMPNISYEYKKEKHEVTVHQVTSHKPRKVSQWFGSVNSVWESVELEMKGDQLWKSTSDWPSKANTDTFVQFEYEWPEPGMSFVLTTPELKA